MVSQGLLISVEGIDGAGKSTVVKRLESELVNQGYPVRVVREPGGTMVSEKIREVLLDPVNQGIFARTEALLYAAARAQLVGEIIRPCLKAGMVVICDRYIDSTLAYQGGGRGIEGEWLETLNQLATGGLMPMLTLLLDLEPLEGRERRAIRCSKGRETVDRLEGESASFYQRVREAYLRQAQEEPGRIRIVNASRPRIEVEEEAWFQVREALARNGDKRNIPG